MELLKLAWGFAQIGIGAFGGGISTLPLIRHILVDNYEWLSLDGFNQVLALAQVTPGPIAVNAATFVGFQRAGLAGAITATLSVVTAPLLIVIAVSTLLQCGSKDRIDRFRNALRPTVAALLTLAFLPLARTAFSGIGPFLLFAAGVGALRLRFFKENPPALFLLSGLAGIVLFL
jgi:chromate transporter